jgi:hypothetical protein
LTKDTLYSGPVDNIVMLIADCNFLQDAYVLVEELPQRVIEKKERQSLLRFARISGGVDLAQYTSGRVFDQHAELRWEKDSDGKYHVVYLGTERELRELKKDEEELKKLKKHEKPKYYYLFGEYLDAQKLENMGIESEEGYYAEVRIPRLLRYPAPTGARRVQLVVCEYLDKDTNDLKLFRFQGLRAAE